MKKLILLILVLCTLTSCAKKNEEFEIRNGIKFGMSKEEVIAIEGEPTRGREDYLEYRDDYIEGIKSTTRYSFQDNCLDLISYSFIPVPIETKYLDDYAIIHKALEQKYGNATIENISFERDDEGYLIENDTSIWYVKQYENDLITITHKLVRFSHNNQGINQIVFYEIQKDSYAETVNQIQKDKL